MKNPLVKFFFSLANGALETPTGKLLIRKAELEEEEIKAIKDVLEKLSK